VDAILNTFLYTAAANAGTRVVGGETAVGTSVPVGSN
jgi:hypothetical protein